MIHRIRDYWHENRYEIGRNLKAYGISISFVGFLVIIITIFGKMVILFPILGQIAVSVGLLLTLAIPISVLTYFVAEIIKEKLP